LGFDSVRIPFFRQEVVFAQAVCVYDKHLEELLVSGVELLVRLIIRVLVSELIDDVEAHGFNPVNINDASCTENVGDERCLVETHDILDAVDLCGLNFFGLHHGEDSTDIDKRQDRQQEQYGGGLKRLAKRGLG
jgi:hypothetical protein